MKNHTVPKEDIKTIDLYLAAGDKSEIDEAIRIVNQLYSRRIYFVIKARVPSANREDILDIYQNFITSLIESAYSGKYQSDPSRFEAYLVRLSYNKAIDWLREKYKQSSLNTDDLLHIIMQRIKSSDQAKEAWEGVYDKEKRSILLKTIYNMISKLPLREKQVAVIIYMNIDRELTDNDIRDLISQTHNEELTTQAVRSARHRLYDKLKEKLQSILS